ncbi:translation elongation factor Ts [candidate division WOR-1 bacterium RIFCSPLOWO2_02_FULL_46_20]|uniref:Elongation factor Ts n=1 Tax=candidate division WOR-1 bacterium RIFCSPLOWO2_02_FULL_46_20 TaxID=1802567 RepID=A0A1F4RDZ6_UNCSA|nr:MAG: translation elongation factor Ts [candidate division WOR-1 bacterium RIFCSPHIGHO2_02_FULL_45_12]OGC06409.1 MAG: translation elongation factor Ts [candidate division WOR-1 bacterium RIFCSPLOWO2_02_FULL_46_20]
MGTSVEEIKDLREKTGCGMMDCKQALKEADGDAEKAGDLLRKKGLASAARRAGRTAAQGLVDSYLHVGGKIGVLVEINCESDFVARNNEFQAFVKNIAMQIAASNPQYITREEVPEAVLQREKDILQTQAKEEGKPAAAMAKIIEGRLNKFYSEICLLEQPFIKDPKLIVRDLLADMVAKIGENIVIRRFNRYQLGENS